MKSFVLLLVLTLCLYSNNTAQEPSVEKSVWGIQTIVFPLTFYNESKLTNKIALRSELAWGYEWSKAGTYDNSNQWAIVPFLIVEPRYYHNLKRRSDKGMRIDGNCGNYLSLFTGIQPGFGITSENYDLFPGILIAPAYGVRRNIGNHFNFEFALGVGYSWEFKESTYYDGETYHHTDFGPILFMRFALGYVFRKQ